MDMQSCKTLQITCEGSLNLLHCCHSNLTGNFNIISQKKNYYVRVVPDYHCIPPLCNAGMSLITELRDFFALFERGEVGQISYVLATNPETQQAQHLTQQRKPSQDHRTAAGEGITV